MAQNAVSGSSIINPSRLPPTFYKLTRLGSVIGFCLSTFLHSRKTRTGHKSRPTLSKVLGSPPLPALQGQTCLWLPSIEGGCGRRLKIPDLQRSPAQRSAVCCWPKEKKKKGRRSRHYVGMRCGCWWAAAKSVKSWWAYASQGFTARRLLATADLQMSVNRRHGKFPPRGFTLRHSKQETFRLLKSRK